jgi:hypothetical protein
VSADRRKEKRKLKKINSFKKKYLNRRSTRLLEYSKTPLQQIYLCDCGCCSITPLSVFKENTPAQDLVVFLRSGKSQNKNLTILAIDFSLKKCILCYYETHYGGDEMPKKPKKWTTGFTIYLPEGLAARLKNQAEEHQVSVSALVRQLLDKYLRRNEQIFEKGGARCQQ